MQPKSNGLSTSASQCPAYNQYRSATCTGVNRHFSAPQE